MSQPLRIGLIMQGGRDWIGGSEYTKNIILALNSLPNEVRSTFEICLICRAAIDSDLHQQLEPQLDALYNCEVDLEAFSLSNRIRWKINHKIFKQADPRWESFLKRERFDFIYPYLSQDTTPKPYRSAAWIFDFQHKYLPHFFTNEELEYRDREFARIASQSSAVVLSSKTAESDFHQFFPEAAFKTKVLSFKTTPSSIWYKGDPLKTQQDYYLPDRFFLVSNQFWQHKNHLTVFKALKLLHEQSIYPIVVCTGHVFDNRKPAYSDEILQTIHKLGLAKQIYLLGLIPKVDQVQLMRRSLAVIQPSLFEGWSTLVEDARCFGKRIILSDLPVNLEQAPPNSVFFEHNSPEQLASHLADGWENLTPGPDLEQERIAQKNNRHEVKNFGYQFLKIAKSYEVE